jgi:bis(5'-nucleosyl)-tetraphosphatase (symmetrical)
MKKRYHYVVGDLQGSFAALQALKHEIDFDESQDCFYFAGDLVARGEDSLATLREVKRLNEKGAAFTILGNHDLNLIAIWRGFQKLKEKDRTKPIFAAADCDELLNWLRQQPLCLLPDNNTVLVHAGVPHMWTFDQLKQFAEEVATVVAGSLDTLDDFLANMYGAQPDTWSDDLEGNVRLRVITNYLTRMRLITAEGQLEFAFKDSLDADMPEGFRPWFDYDSQTALQRRILFGHWAALQGVEITANITALDGGCVWGGQLIAYRLEDSQFFMSATGCGL